MNFKLRYRLRRWRIVFRRVLNALKFEKKIKYSNDIDLSIKIVKRMLSKTDVDIQYSPIASVFHVRHEHLYAKITEHSITIINGKYAYELLLPVQAGYELITRMRMFSERRLVKAEAEHRARIDRSLLKIYEDLDGQRYEN